MADMLADVAELRTFLRDDALDEAHATQALELATGLVQAGTRQRLVHVEDDVVDLAPSRSNLLTLPEFPVLSITSVEGRRWGYDTWDAYDAASWMQSGMAVWTAAKTWLGYERIRVTYDHGYVVIPQDLKAIVLAIAARAVENPNGVRSETIGAYSYTLAGSADGLGAQLTKYERSICNRYRLRTYAMRA